MFAELKCGSKVTREQPKIKSETLVTEIYVTRYREKTVALIFHFFFKTVKVKNFS